MAMLLFPWLNVVWVKIVPSNKEKQVITFFFDNKKKKFMSSGLSGNTYKGAQHETIIAWNKCTWVKRFIEKTTELILIKIKKNNQNRIATKDRCLCSNKEK